MNNLTVFLNTRVENSGTLAWIGDKGLAPFRYLCNGATVRVDVAQGTPKGPIKVEVHHVASFHTDGKFNYSNSDIKLKSSPKSMLRTVVAVILVVPGLLVGLVKVFAYVYSDVRENHRLTKKHFTPRDIVIGTKQNPIENITQLKTELDDAKPDLLNRPIDNLIIHADGQLTINEDPGILPLNPMKLILDGAKIVHRPTAGSRLDNEMVRTGKWEANFDREIKSAQDLDRPFVNVHRVTTIAEAKQFKAARRGWTTCKRYHTVFEVARPQTRAAKKDRAATRSQAQTEQGAEGTARPKLKTVRQKAQTQQSAERTARSKLKTVRLKTQTQQGAERTARSKRQKIRA